MILLFRGNVPSPRRSPDRWWVIYDSESRSTRDHQLTFPDLITPRIVGSSRGTLGVLWDYYCYKTVYVSRNSISSLKFHYDTINISICALCRTTSGACGTSHWLWYTGNNQWYLTWSAADDNPDWLLLSTVYWYDESNVGVLAGNMTFSRVVNTSRRQD